MRTFLLAAAFAAAGSAALAQSSDGASLTRLTAGPSQLIHDGAVWRCDGATCRSVKVRGVPALHACKRMVSEIGAVGAFTWRGRVLDAAELVSCNASAKN
jgi:hypothetical protein